MAEISKIKLPSGSVYDIKDAVARSIVAGAIKVKGTTTTALTDEATTNPITINNESYTAVANDAVFYNKKEFVFDGTKWHEFGDMSGLGSLATKDSVSAVYTPAGSVSVSTKTTTNQTATVSPAGSGDATYTPTGSVAAPTINVSSAGSTATIHNPTKATVATAITAAAPGATAPSNAITYYSVADETLSLYQIGYNTGDSITTSDVTVKTGDAAYSATAPAFTGTGVRLVTGNIAVPDTYDASFSGTQATITST